MWNFGELFCISAIFEQLTSGLSNIARTSFGSAKRILNNQLVIYKQAKEDLIRQKFYLWHVSQKN